MNDESLQRLSLVLSLLGLLGLFLLSICLEPTKVSIKEIDESLLGKFIVTSGYVTKIREHEAGHVFLTLENESSIKVVIFANTARKNKATLEKIRKGSKIEVVGKLVEYKGELELVAKEIRVNPI